MTTLLLIRHGQSMANLEGVFAGNYDAPLTELGYNQAKRTAEFIAENYRVDKVYASDLSRAFETGKCVADTLGLDVIPEPNLREIKAGKWEGIPFEDIVIKYSEEYNKWITDVGNSGCPGGESVKELGKRVLSALSLIAQENEGKTIVIATHATPVRVSQCLIGCDSLDCMKDLPWVSNASVTEVFYDNGKCSLGKVGQDSHLSDLKTNLPNNV